MSVFFVAYVERTSPSQHEFRGIGPRDTREECEKLIREMSRTDVGAHGDLMQPNTACVVECADETK